MFRDEKARPSVGERVSGDSAKIAGQIVYGQQVVAHPLKEQGLLDKSACARLGRVQAPSRLWPGRTMAGRWLGADRTLYFFGLFSSHFNHA